MAIKCDKHYIAHMRSKLPSLLTKLYPTYRVLWRGWIFVVILACVETASLVAHNGRGIYVFLPACLFILPFRLVAEYSNPKPSNIGVSGSSGVWFLLWAVVITLNWYLLFRDQLYQWPTLVVAIIATALVYLARPNIKRTSQ